MHTHVHSEHSWDGILTIDQLFHKTKVLGMPGVVITDHHNLFSWTEVALKHDTFGLKPFYGVELNVGTNHITAIALNSVGAQNIITLNNLGYLKSGKPQVTESELFRHHQGILLLSGCTKGKVSTLLYEENFIRALNVAKEYSSFYKGRYAIELTFPGTPLARRVCFTLQQMATQLQVPCVPMNDVHFLGPSDSNVQSLLLNIRTGGKLKKGSDLHYFKESDEMANEFSESLLMGVSPLLARCSLDFKELIEKWKGTQEIPLSIIQRFDDKEALRRVLWSLKEYKKARYLYNRMLKEDLTLEDVLIEMPEDFKCVNAAFGLRGRIQKVIPDPYRYVSVDQNVVPLYRKNSNTCFSLQMNLKTAKEIGLNVKDRRRMLHYM